MIFLKVIFQNLRTVLSEFRLTALFYQKIDIENILISVPMFKNLKIIQFLLEEVIRNTLLY